MNSQKCVYLIHTLAPAHGAGASNLKQECLMGVRPHQTHTAHFIEYSEGSLHTLQMSHKETSRTTDEFIKYFSIWNMTKTCGLMQDVAGQTGPQPPAGGTAHTSSWR